MNTRSANVTLNLCNGDLKVSIPDIHAKLKKLYAEGVLSSAGTKDAAISNVRYLLTWGGRHFEKNSMCGVATLDTVSKNWHYFKNDVGSQKFKREVANKLKSCKQCHSQDCIDRLVPCELRMRYGHLLSDLESLPETV